MREDVGESVKQWMIECERVCVRERGCEKVRETVPKYFSEIHLGLLCV